MSDVMLFGVLKMPYEMAMQSELSRIQFYQRVQQLVARVEAQPEQEPVAIPGDVRKVANAMQKDGYRGPLAWAKTVIDFVADYTTPPQPKPLTEQEVEAGFEAWMQSDDWKKHASDKEYPISHMGMQQLSVDCMRFTWQAAHNIGAKP